jgi:hypothetical protein
MEEAEEAVTSTTGTALAMPTGALQVQPLGEGGGGGDGPAPAAGGAAVGAHAPPLPDVHEQAVLAGMKEGEGGVALSDGREAARLAKEWYDAGGPLSGDLVLGEVTAAHMNYTDGWDAEWSLRYTVDAAPGSMLPREAVEPLLQEKYFVRFFYEYDQGKWACYGLDEHKASAEVDSGVDLDLKLWAKLVLRCAKALRRASSNLPAYVAEGSIQLQLGALGADSMRKILSLSSKEGDLDEQEKQCVIDTLDTAMRSPSACAACDTTLNVLAPVADSAFCALLLLAACSTRGQERGEGCFECGKVARWRWSGCWRTAAVAQQLPSDGCAAALQEARSGSRWQRVACKAPTAQRRDAPSVPRRRYVFPRIVSDGHTRRPNR